MTTSPLDLPALKEQAASHEHYSRHRNMELPSSTVLALIARVEVAEGEVLEEIGNRDALEEKLTELVYSLATVEEVGEWSSGNDIADNLTDHIGWKIQRLEARATAAEAAISRVREVLEHHTFVADDKYGDLAASQYYGDSELDAVAAKSITRALDGEHTKQLGGTPTGEFADVCSCGKSYWPCDSLDGGA